MKLMNHVKMPSFVSSAFHLANGLLGRESSDVNGAEETASGRSVADAFAEATIRLVPTVPDFPKAGIDFKDINFVYERHPEIFRGLIKEMCRPYRKKPPSFIVAVESYGYVFAAPMAYELGARLLLARQGGKLPGITTSVTYEMGYASSKIMELHSGVIASGDTVAIVDDVLATGGTAKAATALVQKVGGNVAGVSFLGELLYLNARNYFEERSIPVHSVLKWKSGIQKR